MVVQVFFAGDAGLQRSEKRKSSLSIVCRCEAKNNLREGWN